MMVMFLASSAESPSEFQRLGFFWPVATATDGEGTAGCLGTMVLWTATAAPLPFGFSAT